MAPEEEGKIPTFLNGLEDAWSERIKKLTEAGLTDEEITRVNNMLRWELRVLRPLLELLIQRPERQPLFKNMDRSPETLEARQSFSDIIGRIRAQEEKKYPKERTHDIFQTRDIVREQLVLFFSSVLIPHIRRPRAIDQERKAVRKFLNAIIDRIKEQADDKGRDPQKPLLSLPEEAVAPEVTEIITKGVKKQEGRFTISEITTFIKRLSRLAFFQFETEKQDQRIKLFWEAARRIHNLAKRNIDVNIASPEEVEMIIETFLAVTQKLCDQLPPIFQEGSLDEEIQEVLCFYADRFDTVRQNHIIPVRRQYQEYERVVSVFSDPQKSLVNFLSTCNHVEKSVQHLSNTISPSNAEGEPNSEDASVTVRDHPALSPFSKEVIELSTFIKDLHETAHTLQKELENLCQALETSPHVAFGEHVTLFRQLKMVVDHMDQEITRISKDLQKPVGSHKPKYAQKPRDKQNPLQLAMQDQVTSEDIQGALQKTRSFLATMAGGQRDNIQQAITVVKECKHIVSAEQFNLEGVLNMLLSNMTMLRKQYLAPAALHLVYADPRNAHTLPELVEMMFPEGMEEVVHLKKFTEQLIQKLNNILQKDILPDQHFNPDNITLFGHNIEAAVQANHTEEPVLQKLEEVFTVLDEDFLPSVHQLRGHAAIYNQDSSVLGREAVELTRLIHLFQMHVRMIFTLRTQGAITTIQDYPHINIPHTLGEIYTHIEVIQAQLFHMLTGIHMRNEYLLHQFTKSKGKGENGTSSPETTVELDLTEDDIST